MREMPRETAIAWFARSRDMTVDQLTEDEVDSVMVHILRMAQKKGIQVGPTGEPLETFPDGSSTVETTHLILVSRRISLRKWDGPVPNIQEGPREALVRDYLTSQGA